MSKMTDKKLKVTNYIFSQILFSLVQRSTAVAIVQQNNTPQPVKPAYPTTQQLVPPPYQP